MGRVNEITNHIFGNRQRFTYKTAFFLFITVACLVGIFLSLCSISLYYQHLNFTDCPPSQDLLFDPTTIHELIIVGIISFFFSLLYILTIQRRHTSKIRIIAALLVVLGICIWLFFLIRNQLFHRCVLLGFDGDTFNFNKPNYFDHRTLLDIFEITIGGAIFAVFLFLLFKRGQYRFKIWLFFSLGFLVDFGLFIFFAWKVIGVYDLYSSAPYDLLCIVLIITISINIVLFLINLLIPKRNKLYRRIYNAIQFVLFGSYISFFLLLVYWVVLHALSSASSYAPYATDGLFFETGFYSVQVNFIRISIITLAAGILFSQLQMIVPLSWSKLKSISRILGLIFYAISIYLFILIPILDMFEYGNVFFGVGIKLINEIYSYNTKFQILYTRAFDLILLLIIIAALSIFLSVVYISLPKNRRFFIRVSSISSLLLCLLLIGGAIYICYISPFIQFSPPGGQAAGVASDLTIPDLQVIVTPDRSQTIPLKKQVQVTIRLASKDGHTHLSQLIGNVGGSPDITKNILGGGNPSCKPSVEAGLDTTPDNFEVSQPQYRTYSLDLQSVTMSWSVTPEQSGYEFIDSEIILTCGDNPPYPLAGYRQPTFNFHVFNPNDNFISQTFSKVDPSAAITAALGTLLAGLVGFLAAGIWKFLRHSFEKGGPTNTTQEKRGAISKRKQKTKRKRASPTLVVTPPPLEKTTPATRKEPVTPSLSQESSESHLPSSPQPKPGIRLKKSVVIALLVTFVCILIFVPAIGLYHQAKVYNDQTNAEIATAKAANATGVASGKATATAITANPDPYDHSAVTSYLYDPLTQPNYWANKFDGSCQFMNDGYHIVEPQKTYFNYCDATFQTYINNFVFEIKMTINQGDCGGLDLRYDPITNEGYIYFVCSDGNYQFYRYNNNKSATLLKSGKNSGITSGRDATIAVVASGSDFTLYVNKTQLNSVTDSTYNNGEIGLIAYNYNKTTEVIYSDARMWTL